MSRSSRIALYQEIEKLRKRPLIVYVTSERPNAIGQMTPDVIPELCDQILALPKGCEKIDLMIVSSGGDPMVAWRTISILREKVKEIAVLVPQMAYSAATLLALGADEIIMHPFGNLGPIDPQITVHRKDLNGKNTPLHFSAEDMDALLDFAREKARLSDQQQMSEAFKLICEEAGALPVGFALRSSRLSHKLGVKLLQTRHKAKGKEDEKSVEIVERLNKQYFTHGYALGRAEAKEIGLKVVFPKPDLEDAMWRLWKEIEGDIKSTVPFDPIALAASNPQLASLFAPLPSAEIPANAPKEVVEAIWKQIVKMVPVPQYPVMDVVAVPTLLESARIHRMFKRVFRISPFRTPDGAPAAHVTCIGSGWSDSVDSAD